ncbi:LysR substrate-binding domain-containing protein [Cribrihabitans pelagius]|uniref:LysR substrate-binding domain-containing protein n=1 Tax=Cribrihabitans pelagius TaxID=1765746 RepID=UPI003B5BAB99
MIYSACMYKELPPLMWLRAFDASARLGTFTLAAEELGLTPSAVSYQVRGLEAQLGHKLFRRERKTLVLTQLGQAYRPVVAKAFADLDATTSNLFGRGAEAEITLRCVSSLNFLWLVPRLERFKAASPASRLRVLSASWAELAEGEQIDVDIRYGDGNWPDGEVLPLMTHKVIAVCAPALRGSGDPQDLARGPLIELAGVVDTWRHFFALHGPDCPVPEPAYKMDQSLIALELASRGLGTALVAEVFARPYLERGDLVQASGCTLPARQGHYLVLPAERNRFRPEVSALVAWLQEEARGSSPPRGRNTGRRTAAGSAPVRTRDD